MSVIPVAVAGRRADNATLAVILPLDQMTLAAFPRADTHLSGPGDQVPLAAQTDQRWSSRVEMCLGISSWRVLGNESNEAVSRKSPGKVAMTSAAMILQGQLTVQRIGDQVAEIDMPAVFRPDT